MKTNEEFNEHLRTALGIISGRIDISRHYKLDLLDRMGCSEREWATAKHVLEKAEEILYEALCRKEGEELAE